jgi:hypothetical protein
MDSLYHSFSLCLSAFVAMSRFIQIIGQISRPAFGGLEMTLCDLVPLWLKKNAKQSQFQIVQK